MDNEIKAKVKIEPDSAGAQRSADDIKKVGDSTDDASSKAKSASFSFKDFAVNAGLGATAILGAAGGIAAMAIQAASTYQNSEIAFTTLLGSADKAKKALENIQTDAKITPFNMQTLVQANQLLIGAGVSAGDARKTIDDLGKAVFLTGGNSSTLERLAANLQQIKAVGKASAVDVKQFAFAGINIYQMLADTMHLNVDQVKDMDIGYTQLAEAFAKFSDKGGKYADAYTNSAKSFQTAFSNLQDTFSIGLKDIAIKSGLFDTVVTAVTNLTSVIQDHVPQIIAFFQAIGGNPAAIAGIAGAIGGLMVAAISLLVITMGPAILGALAFAAAGALIGMILQLLWPVIVQTGIFLGQHKEILVGIATFIAVMLIPTIFGLIGALWSWVTVTLAAVIPAIFATIVSMLPLILIAALVAGAVALLYMAWANNWGNIRGVTESIVNFIIGKINALIDRMNALIGIYNVVVSKLGLANLKLGEIGKLGAISIDKNVNVGGGIDLPSFSGQGQGNSGFTGAQISGGNSASIINNPTTINQTNNNYTPQDLQSSLGDLSWALKTK